MICGLFRVGPIAFYGGFMAFLCDFCVISMVGLMHFIVDLGHLRMDLGSFHGGSFERRCSYGLYLKNIFS